MNDKDQTGLPDCLNGENIFGEPRIPSFGFEGVTTDILIDRLQEFIDLKADIAGLERKVKRKKDKALALEEECYTKMCDVGVQSINIKSKTAYCRTDVFCSMAADHKEEAGVWLREEGYADLFYETINSRTLSAAMKDFMKDGGELPTELITMKVKNRIGIRGK